MYKEMNLQQQATAQHIIVNLQLMQKSINGSDTPFNHFTQLSLDDLSDIQDKMIVEYNKSLSHGWFGIDLSLQESLMEYGIIIRKVSDAPINPHLISQSFPDGHKYAKDYDYQYIIKSSFQVIQSDQKINTPAKDLFHVGGFDISYINEKINDLLVNKNNDIDLLNFLSHFDYSNISEFLESNIERKIYDLLSYFSYENIFGSNYSEPDTLEKLIILFPELKNLLSL